MPKDKSKERVNIWFGRVNSANKSHEKWAKDFTVAKSKRYWTGKQRIGQDQVDDRGEERASVNLILPTIGIRIPSLYFYFPYCRILAAPNISGIEGSTFEDRAQLLQDVANTIVRDSDTGFKRETLMALKESMWGFGIIEVGYSADFVDNPYYIKPPLAENEDVKDDISNTASSIDTSLSADALTSSLSPTPETPQSGMEPDALSQLKQLVQKEQFFVKHIPPEQFRVSVSGQPFIEANDWCGYYEWVNIEDIKAATAYDPKATKSIKSGGSISKDYSSFPGEYTSTPGSTEGFDSDSKDKDRDRSGQVKVWKIWDIRQKVRYVIAEGCDKFLIDGEPYKNLPLFPLTFEDQDDDWYPVPPIHAMIGPQNEYNEAKEMLRGLRKQIHPRYVAEHGIDPEELRKLEDGGPGVIARVQSVSPVPVQPIQQPSWDSQLVRALAGSKEDLLQVSGVSGEARGQAESDTATQANIINQRALVRDSFGRLRVAEWLGCIIKGLIRLAIDKMSLPMWILRNCDPQAPTFLIDAANLSKLYREITLTDLKEADQLLRWDVSVDVETLSPLTEDTQRAQIINLVTLLAQPPVAMLLHNSEPLVKIVLDRSGIRSAKDQEAIRMALGIVATTSTAVGGVPSQPNQGAPGVPLAPTPPGVNGPSQQMPDPGTQGLPLQGTTQPGGPPSTVPSSVGPVQ